MRPGISKAGLLGSAAALWALGAMAAHAQAGEGAQAAPQASNPTPAQAAPAQTPPVQREAGSDAAAASSSVNVIVVTGQRRLSRDPEDAKRSAVGVVDSVGALEIQQLTDTTVGDALTRLPGIASERAYQSGKTWYVDIRGLEGNYNSVDIDGGMFIDSDRNDRETYLDTVPASAINELVVTKTVTPDMDPNSIGGHISIQTLRSFDLGGQPLVRGDAALDWYQQDGAPKSNGPGGSADIVAKRTFGPEGNFGAVFAASFHHDDYSETYNSAGTYSVVNGVDVPSGAQEHGNFDMYDRGYSFLGKLEARHGDQFYAFTDINYFKEDINQANYRGSFNLNGQSVTNATEGAGDFTGGTAQAYSREYDIDRQVMTITSGFDYAATNKSKVSVVLSYGNSNHNETLYNGSLFQFGGLSGSYNLGSNGASFALAPSAGLGNPANWKVTPSSAAVITHLPMTDDVYTFRTDYNYNTFDFSRGFGFDAGASLRRLHRVFNQSADNYTLPAGSNYSLDQALVGGANSAFNGTGVAYVDFNKYWNFTRANGIDNPTTTPTSSYDLTEDVMGAYTSVHYTTDKLKALAGVRWEYTGEDDNTAQLDGSTPVPFHFNKQYAYFLPNVQASYDAVQGVRLRAAYTETIARPTFTNFAQGLTINNFSSLTPFIRGSNADLKARESDNYDLALDIFRPEGYLSIAPFYKKINHEIYNLTLNNANPATGVVTQLVTPENAGKSSLAGIEISGDWRDFTRLSPLLQGVELRANYTGLQGRLGIVNADGSTRTIKGLDMQPSYEANLILAYDHGPFAASMDYSRRGRAFDGVVGATAAGDAYIAPYDTLNLRFAYRPTRNIETFVTVKNLTQSWWRELTGVNGKQPMTAIQDGVSGQVGVQFRY